MTRAEGVAVFALLLGLAALAAVATAIQQCGQWGWQLLRWRSR